MSGTKHDAGKAPWHLLAWDAVRLVVLVLEFGAKKYSECNWERGIVFSRCFAAAQRHMVAWWDREDLDPETQLNHLAHAISELMFALAFVLRGRTDLDDRPVTVAPAAVPVSAPDDNRCGWPVGSGDRVTRCEGDLGHKGPCVEAPAPEQCPRGRRGQRGVRCGLDAGHKGPCK